MKKVIIDNIEVPMSANGDTPRAYRREYNQDLFKDMANMKGKLDIESLENLAYIMARNENKDIGDIDTWLSQFGPLGIINAGPQILDVWLENLETTSESVKK